LGRVSRDLVPAPHPSLRLRSAQTPKLALLTEDFLPSRSGQLSGRIARGSTYRRRLRSCSPVCVMQCRARLPIRALDSGCWLHARRNYSSSAVFVTIGVHGGFRPVSRADEYRRRAQRCLEMAGTFREREARVALSHMADAWLRLADRYQHANQIRPTFQQQQQLQPRTEDKKA